MREPTAAPELDRVVIALPDRARDLVLAPDVAERLVARILAAAQAAEAWELAGGRGCLVVGIERGALVRSWDGNVNVRFDSVVDREFIPWRAAVALAGEIQAKIVEAREHLCIVWAPR